MAIARWYGVNAPFIGGVQNIMSRQVDEKLIKNDILQLIMTLPGERVYRPGFGTQLRATVFETVSDGSLGNLAQNIRNAIESYEDRVAVDAVNCVAADDGQTVNVRVDVSLTSQPLVKYFIELSFNQNGTITIVK